MTDLPASNAERAPDRIDLDTGGDAASTDGGCHGGKDKMLEAAKATFSINTPPIIRSIRNADRMINRKACARLLGRSGWACA